MSTKEEPGVEEPVDATVAVPMADAGELAMKDQEKQGGKCCFFCCDYRRAVVVISILQMINSLVWLVLFAGAGGFAVVGSLEAQNNDDLSSEGLAAAAGASYILAAMYGFFFLCNIFVLCAALRYSVCMLSTTIIIVLIQFGISIWNVVYRVQYSTDPTLNPTTQYVVGIIGSIIGYGLYLYPIIGLTSEIKNGIMSRETYPREAYSCCCTPKF